MILDKECVRFHFLAVRDLPSWRLWNKEDGTDNNYAGKSLQDDGDAPRVIVLNKVSTVCNGSCGNRSSKPSTVEKTCPVNS